jgi:hypothetical protein
LAVDDDFAALVAELIHPANELLDRDADGAVDVSASELSRATDIEKQRTLCDEVAGVSSRDSYRGETHVEHGRRDDDQDDYEELREHGPKDSRAPPARHKPHAKAASGRKAR